MDGDTCANCHAYPIQPNPTYLCDTCRRAADGAMAQAPHLPGKDHASFRDVDDARQRALAQRRAEAGG